MILDRPSLAELEEFRADLCVVGSGPVGIITAIALADRGLKVLLLESGGRAAHPDAQALSQAEKFHPENHFAPETVIARRLGGTSNLWGGRCLPFDTIDYSARPWLDLTEWPIAAADLAPYLASAVERLGAGVAVYRASLPGVIADAAFDFEALERWSNWPQTQKLHARALKHRTSVLVALHTTVTGFAYDERDRITALELFLESVGRVSLPASMVILTGGGLESTRLLLAERRKHPSWFGGSEGPLGRYYMGHLAGQIAEITFSSRTLHDGLNFFVDSNRSYVRRRLIPSPRTQKSEELTNSAFWPVLPKIADPVHRSGPLSAAFLALSVAPVGRWFLAEPMRVKHLGKPPYARSAHAANILRDLPRTLAFLPWFLWQSKIASMRLPGFFLPNSARRYELEYHCEHLPNPASRVTLAETVDRMGLPRLRLDLRFSNADAAAVLASHDALESWLARNGLGQLYYHPEDRTARAAAVLAAARDGAHQIGTIRMGVDSRNGVVDGNCRTFDVENLYVVSTAVLPSSSHANPTLTAVQLGLRLADWLAGDGATRSRASTG